MCDTDVNTDHLLILRWLCPWCVLPSWYTSNRGQTAGVEKQLLQLICSVPWDIFICSTAPLLHCICDFIIPFMSSECHSPHPPSLQGEPIYHRPKEGLHFVCFWGSPSTSCSPNERGYCVPASPQRLEGARSPVPRPTWGSNYPSGVQLREAPPAGQSNSPTLDSHLWACGLASIVREAPEAGCHMTWMGVMQKGRLSTSWPW